MATLPPPVTPDPIRPADLAGVDVVELATSWAQHAAEVRTAVRTSSQPARGQASPLGALLLGAALVLQVTAALWPTVRSAVESGASWDTITAALGEVDPVAPADRFRAWLGSEYRAGRLTAAERRRIEVGLPAPRRVATAGRLVDPDRPADLLAAVEQLHARTGVEVHPDVLGEVLRAAGGAR